MTRVPCPTVYAEVKTWIAGMKPDDPPIVTTDVACRGALHPCAICGGLRYCGYEQRCLDDQVDTHWVLRRFEIADVYGLYGGELTGWTRGEHWNGWACPRFEKGAADRLMGQVNHAAARPDEMTYDAATDTYRWQPDGQDEPSTWSGERITPPAAGDEGVVVYAIGAWAWVWDEVDA